ncbi:hypothetical protein NEAUS04_2420 [Nematocida ausubeli]|nr:hypothetical protein NEAUS04_2420 [Nematocida ausubeli]
MTKSNISKRKVQLLYKRNNRQISIKLLAKVLLMGTLMGVQNVFGLLSRKEMEEVIREVNNRKENGLEHNMDGPFNPIMLYVYREIDVISNRRFNPQYISTQSSVPDKENILQNIDRTNDTAKEEDSVGNELPKRIVDHYNALVNMFPSPYGKVSIYPKEGCKDFFTSFLKSDPVKEYAHKILAILLLGEEGLNTPLIIEDEESACPRLTWTNKRNPEQSFSVPIYTASAEGQGSNSSSEEENIKKSDRKLLQTIKYFINLQIINPVLEEENEKRKKEKKKESIVQQKLYEKKIDWENEFTETPAWLIQLYIYYYLETKEDAIDFSVILYKTMYFHIFYYRAVCHKRDCIQIYKKVVVREDKKSNELEHWGKVNELENIIMLEKEIKLLPFANISEVPAKRRVAIDIPKSNQDLETERISSDIESVLLTLLCCFAYDAETNEYRFNHIRYTLEEVKSLFGCVYNPNLNIYSYSYKMNGNPAICKSSSNSGYIRVGNEIPQEVWSKWSKIIQKVVKGDEDISYIDVCGIPMIENNIFNVLTILLKITGVPHETYREQVQMYRKRLNSQEFRNGNPRIKSFNKELISCAAKIILEMSIEYVSPERFVDWLFSSSRIPKGFRSICVSFEDYNVQTMGNTNYLSGSMKIHYVTENKARPIVIHFVSPETVNIGIGKCAVKSNDPEVNQLKKEIRELRKASYNMHVLSKYAETIRLHTSGDILFDKFYINKIKQSRHPEPEMDLFVMVSLLDSR